VPWCTLLEEFGRFCGTPSVEMALLDIATVTRLALSESGVFVSQIQRMKIMDKSMQSRRVYCDRKIAKSRAPRTERVSKRVLPE
jgi:hypothetical protein